jgi:hypothetical protein
MLQEVMLIQGRVVAVLTKAGKMKTKMRAEFPMRPWGVLIVLNKLEKVAEIAPEKWYHD